MVAYSYDSIGKITITDATAKQSTLYLGVGGQVAKVRDGQNNNIHMGYDNNFQLNQMTGASGQQYNYSYDSKGNVTDVEDPLRKNTSFSYEPSFNNLTSFVDPRSNGISYSYDSSGNLTSITYQDGTIESFTYDTSGLVLSWTNRRGDTVTYTYNTRGQLTGKDYSNTTEPEDCNYVYDDTGNLISASDPCGTITMTYDPNTDWLARIDYPGGYYFTLQYDNLGQRTQRTDQNDNVVKYVYDTVGRLDQMTDGNDALVVDYDYDVSGRLSLKTLGNGVYTTYEYNNAGHLTSLVHYKPNDTILSSFDYTYDSDGRRTSMTTLDGTYTYNYDPLGQLIKVTYPDAHVVKYIYDAVGNRIEVIDDSVSIPYTTNNMNQYTDVNGTVYTYDADGNMKTKTEGGVTTRYTYDIENRLVGISTPTDTWDYYYDAMDNRIATKHNGAITNYIIDPVGLSDIAVEYDGSGTLIACYDHGFGLLARTDQTGISAYYTFDAIGSTSEITSETASILNSYTYGPFGLSLTKSEAIQNPFQFIGKYGVMHENNDLQFMRARFYKSCFGRFLSEDPIGIAAGDINFYRYCIGNPITRLDPLGLDTFGWFQGIRRRTDLVNELLADPLSTSKDWDDKYVRANQQIVNNTNGFIKDLAGLINYTRRPLKFEDLLDLLGPLGLLWNAVRGSGLLSDHREAIGEVNIPYPQTEPFGDADTGVSHMVDPSDKLGSAGFGDARFIDADNLLAYKIRFENEPDATAPAHIIRITDTFDTNLDLSTFELAEIAFAGHTIVVPEGLNHYEAAENIVVDNEFVIAKELRVEIDIWLDISSRELTLEMIGLDPNTGWLPEDIMLGILYPNDDTGRGDGHISFTVKPLPDLATGTQITNKASIKFDWNDELITPLVLNTIDSAPAVSQVNSLPAEANDIFITIDWSGVDDGSGVARYDIYVSDNGGDYVLWLGDTTNTNTTFIGEHGHTYSFYSLATDNVGNTEEVPIAADANITLYDQVPPQVVNVVVNEGQAQRSRIGKLAVQFSEPLSVDKNILTLYNNTIGAPVDLSGLTAADFIYVESIYMAMWELSDVNLVDANYTATILAADVNDGGGNHLDGNGDGTGRDNYTFNFFKLFGDFDGGSDVDFIDFSAFAQKWLDTGCAEPYWCDGADSELDGDVDANDLAAFSNCWLRGVE